MEKTKQQWKKPQMNPLTVEKLENKTLTIESSLYASGSHRGDLTQS